MLLVRSILFPFLAIACSILAEATSHMRSTPKDVDLKVLQVKQTSADKAHISPELEPASSEHFFKKDYPFDKRPVADPFHFKHPYPVVQDSSDFDKDYVKDENSDNGNWKAQETYDRLRSKLRKEKKELAEAMRRKGIQDHEMKDALSRHAKEEKDRDEAAKKVDRLKRDEAKRRQAANQREKERRFPWGRQDQDANGEGDKDRKKDGHDGHDGHDDSGPESEDVAVSTEETERAMKNLEDCKKQLAEARQRLKELMKELQDAKTAQTKANAAMDETMKKELSEKEHHSTLKKEVNREYREYMEAKEAYEKHEAYTGKLEIQIKAAAAKVKAMRDSADASGGVYNTPEETPHKAGVPTAHGLWAFPAIVAVWMASA